MEPMESGNFLLYAVEAGARHVHLVRPVTDGQQLAIRTEAAELETVTVLSAIPPGYVGELEAPIARVWPSGTPVGIVIATV
jgi:hypothetical protein